MNLNNISNICKFQKYNSLIEAAGITVIVKKICGLAVINVVRNKKGKLESKFSLFGLVAFLFWIFVYVFCTYKAFYDDQTILRRLYDTKLGHYGDVLEKLICVAFVSYAVCKISFEVGIHFDYIEQLLEIDERVKILGVHVDYNKMSRLLFWSTIGQVIAGSTRLFSVWILLSNLDMQLPLEVLVQASLSDILVLALSSHYFFYLHFVAGRYKMVNNLLIEIRDRKSWEHTVLVRGKQTPNNMTKALQYQEKYICEKIKACARIYALLFKATEKAQYRFGFALVCTLLFCLFYIILYLFYFMEATAGGLFHDMEKFIYFLVFVFWQILYSTGVIFLNVYISESVVSEAAKTSYIIHQIVNADFGPSINSEAMYLSIQLLHQVPVFTACGLCRIDYKLLLQGSRTITTFLVILLQFVTN